MISEACVIREYADLVETLAQRRRDMGLTQWELAQRAGLHDGYVGKLESWKHPRSGRKLGAVSMPILFGALGVSLVLVTKDGVALPCVRGKPTMQSSIGGAWPNSDVVLGLA